MPAATDLALAAPLPRAGRVGVDVVSIAEVERSVSRFGDRYVGRLFTDGERRDVASADPGTAAAGLAARFAVKEAVIKILAAGEDVPGWREIESQRQPGGAPGLRLSGTARRLAERAGLARWSVSMSHDSGVAVAMVLAEPCPPQPGPSPPRR